MSSARQRIAVRRREPEPTPLSALQLELDGIVHVLTCGSVDDGKSTLIGRLLWDAHDIPDDQRAQVERSAGPDGIPDYSLLVDGLLAEREQGITIDIAWRYIEAGARSVGARPGATSKRRIVIIDSPGHEQYTRNMASGASHADVAVMLIDARHGIKAQTRRHAAILDLVGVRHVVLAVNKMDLVGWSEARFRAIEAEFKTLAWRFGFHEARTIPVSAKCGDNVARRSSEMAWFDGPTLLDALSAVPSRASAVSGPFRFPVQTVLRNGDFRGLAGTVVSGAISVGDRVIDTTSGKQAQVARIATMDGDLPRAVAGRAVAIELDTDLDIARGAVLAAPGKGPQLVAGFEARLVWMADAPYEPGRGLLLRTATDLVPVEALEVSAALQLETLAQVPATSCVANDIALVEITLARPTALDAFADVPATGAFVLVDVLTGATVAGGTVKALRAGPSSRRRGGFVLTTTMLSAGLCSGLAPGEPEFRRRAQEATLLLQLAGVRVSLAVDPAI